jgi:ADP-heptose:LPS heptosyltransferase
VIVAEWQRVQRLLIVRLDNLGDVLLTTPAIRLLRASLPDAHFVLLSSPVGAQVGRLNPDIDEVLTYQAPWVDPWQRLPFDPERERAMVEELRARQFDGAVIFTTVRQSPLPAAYLCYLAGAPLRLGGTVDATGSLLTTRHKYRDGVYHEVERCAELVRAIGVDGLPGPLVLDVPDGDRVEAEMVWSDVPGSGPRVVVHPGCSMPARTYPADRYAQVVQGLVREADARVVVTGGPEEAALLGRLASKVSPAVRERVRFAAGAWSFPMFCGVAAAADAVITNNTGPMHIAAAVETPVVALFALTNPPEQWRPWGRDYHLLNRDVPCRTCFQRSCPLDHACLLGVSPSDVVRTTLAMIDGVERVDRRWAGVPALSGAGS